MPFEKDIANMGHTYLISLPVSRDYHNNSRGTVGEIFQARERVYLHGIRRQYYGRGISRPVPATVTEGKALLYFTHSQEAFKPVTQAKNGKIAVSHQTENITKFGEKLKTQLTIQWN